MDVAPHIAAQILATFHGTDAATQSLLRLASVFGKVVPLAGVAVVQNRFALKADISARSMTRLTSTADGDAPDDKTETLLSFKVPLLLYDAGSGPKSQSEVETSELDMQQVPVSAMIPAVIQRLKPLIEVGFLELHDPIVAGDDDKSVKASSAIDSVGNSSGISSFLTFRSEAERAVVYHQLLVADRKRAHVEILDWFKDQGPMTITEVEVMAAAAAASSQNDADEAVGAVETIALTIAAAPHSYHGTLAKHALSCDSVSEAFGHCARAFVIALEIGMPDSARDYADDCAFMIELADGTTGTTERGSQELEVIGVGLSQPRVVCNPLIRSLALFVSQGELDACCGAPRVVRMGSSNTTSELYFGDDRL